MYLYIRFWSVYILYSFIIVNQNSVIILDSKHYFQLQWRTVEYSSNFWLSFQKIRKSCVDPCHLSCGLYSLITIHREDILTTVYFFCRTYSFLSYKLKILISGLLDVPHYFKSDIGVYIARTQNSHNLPTCSLSKLLRW